MKIALFGKTIFETTATAPTPQAAVETGYRTVSVRPFDGEKDFGEMGVIKEYVIDHDALRLRAWQQFLDSDVCQALFQRTAIWAIGTGLKLQAEPKVKVLEKAGVKLGEDFAEEFNEDVEALFDTYANSTLCDYAGQRTLSEIATETWINKDVGGDVLIVLRLINGTPKVQIIDGCHLRTPLSSTSFNGVDYTYSGTGNRIRQGIEIDATGKHVAYFVRKGLLPGDYERIPARMDKYPYSETARLVYGLKYRTDNVRGIPMISAVMETASKMARYREATLGKAEELAKVVYQVVHEAFSSGENPALGGIAEASGYTHTSGLPTDSQLRELANKVQATMNKQTFNNPQGAKIEPVGASTGEVNFADFYSINFDIVCAVAGYPPEVIMSKYNSNYSASRAAIKDFEHTLTVKRGTFANQFYQLIYNFWLDVQVLTNKIDAPGYLIALQSRDELTLAAYRSACWDGDAVPHIDPYKEVQAIRAMLPEDTANFPLITLEKAVSMLPGGGDYNTVVEQYAKERDKGKANKIELVPPKTAQPVQPNGNPKKDD